jgi:hypothetical protein
MYYVQIASMNENSRPIISLALCEPGPEFSLPFTLMLMNADSIDASV